MSEDFISVGSLFRPDELPEEYKKDFLRLFRPAISRILKKANKQIKETKQELKLLNPDTLFLDALS